MTNQNELNPPCERFEHDPGHDDPADPGRKFCWCGWTQDEHPGDDPAEMINAIQRAHRQITQGCSDEALDILAWFLTDAEIKNHNDERDLDGWLAERAGNK